MHTFIAALFIKLFRILNLCLCRKTWTWWGVFLFMVLRMFHFFQAIFATNFNVKSKYYLFCSLWHIQTNLHLKLTIYFKHKVTFLWAISQKSKETLKMFVPHPSLGHFSKELKDIEDVCPSSQCGTLRKKIVCTKKPMKLTVLHQYEIWGHQFLTEIIFISCKEILKALLLV